ncbi:HAD-IA family hydrolase [Paenibacillus sp.]|uniref:HAD family hydrolase n=1 Tax=Paenibacillus sp. TaxID=58172 RepID=UPI0028AC9DC0|nr:HAD-IA family hydrolase [Paenibacillus sp.]
MQSLKAVIFDLDDTLYQEVEYVKSGFLHVSRFLSEETSLNKDYVFEQFLQLFQKDKNEVFKRFLDVHSLQSSQLETQMIYEYRFHLPLLTLAPENVELLEWLREKGMYIGIITDGRPEGQRNKIEALLLNKYCDHIIVTDELGGIEFRKPNDAAFIKMLRHFNIKPEESIYIGDNPAKDFVAGNKLGMHTIMLKNEKSIHPQIVEDSSFHAKISVLDLYELKHIVESW